MRDTLDERLEKVKKGRNVEGEHVYILTQQINIIFFSREDIGKLGMQSC